MTKSYQVNKQVLTKTIKMSDLHAKDIEIFALKEANLKKDKEILTMRISYDLGLFGTQIVNMNAAEKTITYLEPTNGQSEDIEVSETDSK